MFISPSEAMIILEHYKYWLIFPIAVFEGPIIIIISGFLVSLGYLNVIVAYVVLVVADMIGDSLYYLLGKSWRKSLRVKKYTKFLGYDEKSEAFLEEHFRKHKGVGGAVQISSGIANVSYFDFIWFSFVGTSIKVFALMIVGYYLGSSYIKIDSVLDRVALVVVSISFLLIAYVFINKYAKNKLGKK